jgi:hypothetical protein
VTDDSRTVADAIAPDGIELQDLISLARNDGAFQARLRAIIERNQRILDRLATEDGVTDD